MRVDVDFDLCESNAVCMGLVPEIFELRDDDRLYLLREDVPDELLDATKDAVVRCPRQAIKLVED